MGYKLSVISIDIEATKIPQHTFWTPGAYLCSVGIAHEDGTAKTWLFTHRTDAVGDACTMLREIQDEIDKADLVIGHNLKFDLNWLKHAGIDFSKSKFWCTMIADYLINGQQKVGYALDKCCARYGLPLKHDRMKDFWNEGYQTDEIPTAIQLPYLEQDCKITMLLYQAQMPYIQSLGLSKIAQLSFEVTDLLSDVESNGVQFNLDSALEYVDEYKTKVVSLDRRLNELAGMEFNVGSGQQLSAVMFGGDVKVDDREYYTVTLKNGVEKERSRKIKRDVTLPGLGFKPIEGTELAKEGYFSTDKNVLAQLRARTKLQKEFIALLHDRAVTSKVLSTFTSTTKKVSGLISKVGKDGKIHPSFNQTVTSTGRLSSSNPNGQNLPRKGTSPIKKVFVPTNDIMINVDLGQLEYRMAAQLSGDKTMIHEIENGLDAHADNAIRFFGATRDKPEEFSKLRTTAKVFTFGLLYGCTAAGFTRNPSMPPYSKKQWQTIIDSYYDKYHGLKSWQTRNVATVNKYGYLQNPSGRRLKFVKSKGWDGVPSYSPTQIYNFPVQSGSADVVYLAMAVIRKRMRDRGLKSKIVLQVHDSLVIDAISSEQKEICNLAIDVFEELPKLCKQYWGWDFVVPMTGDCEVGFNYGEVVPTVYPNGKITGAALTYVFSCEKEKHVMECTAKTFEDAVRQFKNSGIVGSLKEIEFKG